MWGVTTPEEAQAKIDEQKAEAVAKMKADGVSEPRNLEEQAQVLIGKDIYERLIKGYTEKQWGRKCTDLPAFIIKRLPVRLIFDNNYFNDKYQGIPIGGYNKLIDGLLEGIDTMTSVDFFADNIQKLAENKESSQKAGLIKDCWQEIAEKLVFTGKIDQFYDYQFGKLNYRTVRFEQEIIDSPNYQGNAVVNYTEQEVPYTRVIEHKHFEMFGAEVYNCPKTVISKEYSTEWKDGMEPYYPVNDKENSELYAQYKNLADQEKDVIFGGRLAEYKYYDMAPIIEKALAMFK
jgi:UDP-galactopyranose mutase